MSRTLLIGECAPDFSLPTQDGGQLGISNMAGGPWVLFLYGKDELPACRAIALAFREQLAAFTSLGARVVGASLDPPSARQAFAAAHDLQFPLLSDVDQELSKLTRVLQQDDPADIRTLRYTRTALLVDPNLRVVGIYQPLQAEQVPAILDDLRRWLAVEAPAAADPPAPALIIPYVFDREFCRELIRVWDTEGNEESGMMRQQGDRTVGVLDYGYKSRRDHFVKPGPLQDRLDLQMRRRIFPEIKKAFNFVATRREGYKIACYDASQGGFFRAHRDNTTAATAHRRFAMTLNLNVEEYEGGFLKFPEFGQRLYKPPTGGAIIFGCPLLHEATDVTSGRRFTLLNFFYGEQEAAQREAYNREHGSAHETIRV